MQWMTTAIGLALASTLVAFPLVLYFDWRAGLQRRALAEEDHRQAR